MSFWRSRRTLWACAAALVLIFLLWRPGADRFRSRLEQSLGSALGHKVEIGSVSLRILPRPGFNLSQFSVRDDPQFSPEPILRADEVSATLHPSSLWRWRIEIATLSFKDASLNLVRRSDGRWNLEPLLERAAHAPAAPTGNSSAEMHRRFPYIEVSNGRVNLKLGAEKTAYALTNAELALWLESNDEWDLRLRGQPVRTDMRLSDTGTLRANATWHGAEDLRKTSLRLTATYEGAQLGQLTKLVYGADRGWRGTVTASANLTGSAEDLQIQSEVSADSFRRYDIVAGPALRLSATCSGRYNSWPRQLSGILCSTPAQDGSLLLRGKIALERPPAYDLNLNAAKFPAERLAEVFREVKNGLPGDFSATGTVDADISFLADGAGGVTWSGSGKTDHLVLRTSALQAKNGDATLALGTVPFRAISAPSKLSRGRVRGKLIDPLHDTNFPAPGNALEVGPISVDLAEEQRASFHAWFSPASYRATFAGEAPIQRLLQIGRAAGVTAIHPALEGDAAFDWQARGAWGGFSPPQTTGTIHLRNVRAEFPGLNAPVEIASSDVRLTPDTFKLEKLSATAGGVHWTGSMARPRICPGPATCATLVDLHADEILIDKLNLLLNPNIHKQPWYRILTGSTQQTGSALRSLHVQGTLQVDRLVAGDLNAESVATKVTLEDGRLHLAELRASVLGGRHTGDWQADFTKETPSYTFTGALENVSLLQLSKLMHSNWITGTTRGTYELNFAGWSAVDLESSARGTFTVDAQDGAFPRFGLSASPLKFQHVRGTLTTGKALVVITQGKLENAQGIYDMSGVASFGHKLDLKFQRRGGHGFVVTGALEEPHVASITATQR